MKPSAPPLFYCLDTEMRGIPFEFEVPITFFEKAGADDGKRRRIGGIISTENPDRQNEVILQSGLDFSDFLRSGWYNDNHSKDTTGVVGYPEMVQKFRRGDKLPDGSIAPVNGTWAEGYLLKTERANKIWELGQQLQGTGRHLGFSVEGSVLQRSRGNRRVVAKAKVRNVAVTNCPVNEDSRLDILAKSLIAAEQMDPPAWEKALTAGTTEGGLTHPAGPQTGEGAGQVLMTESLETGKRLKRALAEARGEDDADEGGEEGGEEAVSKALTDAEAVAWVQNRIPGASATHAGRIVDLARRLKAQGRL